MNIMKKFMAYTILTVMSLTVVGCTGDKQSSISAKKEDGVIAKVNGKPVYQSDFDKLYEEYYNYFGQTEQAAQYLNEQKALLLEELVNTEVLLQKAEALGVTCTDEEAQEALDNVKNQYGEETFSQMLEEVHLTEEAYLAQIKQQIVLLKLQGEMIKDAEPVTDEEVAAYYEANKANYTVGAGGNMRHILVYVPDQTDTEAVATAEAAVKEIEAQLAAGTSFEDLSKKYSAEDADSDLYIVEDLGFVEYNSPYYDADFLAGAKALAEGEVSGPVKSSFGYHFIKVDNITEESVKPLEDVKSEITQTLEEEKQYARYQETLEKWVKEADAKTYEDQIKLPELAAQATDQSNNTETEKEVETTEEVAE